MKLSRRNLMSGALLLGAATAFRHEESTAATQGRLIVDGQDPSVMNLEYLEMLRKVKVDCIHLSLTEDTHIYMGDVRYLSSMHASEVTIAGTVADILQAKAERKIAIIFGSQVSTILEQELLKTSSYESLARAVRASHGLGLRIQGIAYNINNVFGGGCLSHATPLTAAGRALVESIHKTRIVLDVGGHTGEQTSLDAIEVSKGVPVVCTHTNLKALMPNQRATSNALLEAVARTGGVIGVTALSDFLVRDASNYRQHGDRSPQASLDAFLDQYDYLKKLVGIDHVGLGPDFTHGSDTSEFSTKDYLFFSSEMLGEGTLQYVKGFERITELNNVIDGLKGRGWTEKELDKLLGENWLRVYRQVWGA